MVSASGADIDALSSSFAGLTLTKKRVLPTPHVGGLIGLPTELLNLILCLVAHPADRAVLLRVNKLFHNLVLPMLYHSVEVDLADQKRAASFLSGPGHVHLRRLTLLPSADDQRLETIIYTNSLFAALPEGVLTSFRCDARLPAQSPIIEGLWETQPNMVSAIVDDASKPRDPLTSERQNRLRQLSQCSEVTMHFDTMQRLCHEIAVLQRSKALSSMCVAIRDAEQSFPHGSPERLWALAASLYFLMLLDVPVPSGGNRDISQQPHDQRHKVLRGLKALTLRTATIGFNPVLPSLAAEGGKVVWPYLKKLADLKVLVLQDCYGCTLFLSSLGAQPALWSLTSLVILSVGHSDRASGERFSENIDRILWLWKGLESLVISSKGMSFNMPGIANHSSTLKRLYLDAPGSTDTDFIDDALHLPLSSCAELEQLALPLPPVVFRERDLSSDLPALQTGYHLRMHRNFLTVLAKLRKLVTLRVLNPQVRGSDFDVRNINGARKSLLDEKFRMMAMYAFHSAGQTALSVFAVGSRSLPNGVVEPDCYRIKGAKLESWEEKWSSRVQIRRHLVKYEEPRAEILDIEHNAKTFLRFPAWE